MFKIFSRGPDFEKIFSDSSKTHKFIYGDRAETSTILGDKGFINAWLSSKNSWQVTTIIVDEALKGNIPSLKQMIWLSDIYFNDVDNIAMDSSKRLLLKTNYMQDRVMFCQKAIDRGLKDQSYYAMTSSVKLYLLYSQLPNSMDNPIIREALSGIVKYARLFIDSGSEERELIEDAKLALRTYSPLSCILQAMHDGKTDDVIVESASAHSDGSDEEAKRLFEIGMQHASGYECSKAIEYYTKSITMSPNPAPYVNRANLLAKRLRYREALTDLSEAQRLDQRQGNEFTKELSGEISRVELVSQNYHNGTRDQLIADLKQSNPRDVAGKIFCSSFGIPYECWRQGSFGTFRDIAEFHFFNDIDNVIKFDESSLYPEVDEFRSVYNDRFIEMKISRCPDALAYTKSEITLHSFLCCYDENDMQHLRRLMLYNIHQILLHMDYGDIWSLTSECPGMIREAEGFAG
jgi:hypothetical protein